MRFESAWRLAPFDGAQSDAYVAGIKSQSHVVWGIYLIWEIPIRPAAARRWES